MVFESIPQTGVQIVLILLQLSANVDVDSRQYVTVVTSLLAAGFIGATMDNDVDTNERLRRKEPILYGWLPESKSKRLAFMIMHTCHLGCFMGMRVLSCATLALISPLVFALWLAAEFFLFTAARIYLNTITVFTPIPRLLQHIVNVLTFIMMGFVPVYFMRNMYTTVCGRQFTMSVIYEYIASFAMMFTAMQMQADNTLTMDVLHESMKIVGILAGVSATIVYICVTWFMERKYSYMWWSTRNPAQHFSDYIWDSGIYPILGFELDDHRAEAIAYAFIPKYYLHDGRVEAWVREKLSEWEAEPPLWFNSDFKKRLPQRFPVTRAINLHRFLIG